MKFKNYIISLITITTLVSFLPTLISSQTCSKTCGKLLIKYPFGTGPGCGDPRFEPYITCNNQQLTFTTHTGCYTVTSIDYNNQVIYVSDPTMSTCDCTQPSKGFGLDWSAPFSFNDDTVFALLGCSSTTTSSSYNKDGGNNNSSGIPTCDPQGGSICSLLYSCEAISRLSLPITSCCVYTPVDLGPSFEMDLQKLQCTSYSALYGYNGYVIDNNNPEGWKYGIGLKYKFNYNNDYPANCASCEKTNGVCGYDTISPDKPFSCNCPGGLNTTTDCFYARPWNYGSRILPCNSGVFSMIFSFAWLTKLAFM